MNETTEASALLAPLWRFKWLILIVGILVGAATYSYYKGKPSVYRAKTEVYLGNASEEQGSLGNTALTKKAVTNNSQNQTAIINSPIVREGVVRRLRHTPSETAKLAGHGKVNAKAPEKSEFITVTAEARTPASAALLANSIARAYIKRENANYIREINNAIALARRQLRRIEASLVTPVSSKSKGVKATSTSATLQTASLNAKINQYEAALGVTGVTQVGAAKVGAAELIAPKPKENAIFGFVIGVFLASMAAYVLSRFDRRLRSLSAVERAFETHILTALPTVRRPIVHRAGALAPVKALSEPLRRLHASLRLGELPAHAERASRAILFLSADAGDGKSTVVGALALVQREAGDRVAVIEADFRRPVQSRLLEVGASRGLADVLSGRLELDDALQKVDSAAQSPAADATEPDAGGVTTMLESRSTGAISLLLGEAGAPNPPALLGGDAMRNLLRSASEEFDDVLVDAPPLLQFSDAMPLLPVVDGIVLVARLGHTRELSAQRLKALLTRTPSAPVLGAVAIDVSRSELERFGLPAGQLRRGWASRLLGR